MKTLSPLFLLLLIVPIMLSGCNKPAEKALGEWVRLIDFAGVARSDASSFVIGNNGYIVAGYDGNDFLSDLWTYNSEDETWTQLTDFPGNARWLATAFAIDNKGYFGLGADYDYHYNDFWQYDPSTNTWTQKTDFPGMERRDAVGFGLVGKGYIGCGFNGGPFCDFYQYDPVNNSWTQIADLPDESRRRNCTAFVYNDMAYILGGANFSTFVSSFYRFDPSNLSWFKLSDVSDETESEWDDKYTDIAREHPLSFVIGDKAYITCGNTSTLINSTWKYVFSEDRWYKVADFDGTSRTEGVSFSFGDRGIILTGRQSTYRFDDVWEFLPEDTPDIKK